jgi:transposase
MHREYGRAPSGERVFGFVPENHYQTSTLMGSLSLDGRIQTFVYDGGTDVAAMTTFIQTVLAPELVPGDIVIWDNLPTHHSPTVIEAINRTGAEVWWLPPYSPDMNPIKKLWSKVKSFLRSVAARSKDTLINGLAKGLETITLSDIRNWFINAGYRKMHA